MALSVNAHPALLNVLIPDTTSLASRIRSSIHDPNRRTRTAHTADQAKRRRKTSPAAMIQFDVTSVSAPLPPTTDFEMGETEAAAQPSLTRKTYRLPRELLPPEFTEISKETMASVVPELGEDLPEIEYMRDVLEELGPGLLRVVVNVVVADAPKDTLPTEVSITINDQSDYPPPTHMLAIHPRASNDAPESARRQVILVPVHSAVLVLHCSRLPPFPPSSPTPAYTSEDRTQLTVPVQPLCLPSVITYPLLSAFLYTKRAGHLLESLLPCPPPPTLDQDRTQIPAFAVRLAGTFTSQAMLLHVHRVHGLWQNTCVLGVFLDALWDTFDLAWEVLLTAMAISAGTPQLMLKRPSSPPPPVAVTSEVAIQSP
ncbi:hypothetical protein B0H11DRAFT_1989852 [Mycena galericulata]|nr:hypothetical protein B0H11DRAFT_1989852 [Mycena galericulata]